MLIFIDTETLTEEELMKEMEDQDDREDEGIP